MSERKVANLIIAGAAKCGSTSMFHYLSAHPEILGANVKETKYFMPLKFGNQLSPIEEYQKFFVEHSNEKYLLDGTPNYLFGGKKIAQAIHDTLGEIKIVFIFREPVSRAFSWYQHCLYRLIIPDKISFHEFISEAEKEIAKDKNCWDNYSRAFQEGFYSDALQEWYEVFKSENIKVLFFEDLKKNPRQVLNEVCSWLKIDSSLIPDDALKPENTSGNFRFKWFRKLFLWAKRNQKKIFFTNKSLNRYLKKFEQRINKKPRTEKLNDEDKKYLQHIFKPHNENLKKLLVEKGYSNFPGWVK